MQTYKTNLISINDSLGIIVPDEVVKLLQLQEGDSLVATASNNGISFTKHDSSQVSMGKTFMNEYQDTFTKLAN
jgi:antitoxin component of MazEF toxin-antitoxin module